MNSPFVEIIFEKSTENKKVRSEILIIPSLESLVNVDVIGLNL